MFFYFWQRNVTTCDSVPNVSLAIESHWEHLSHFVFGFETPLKSRSKNVDKFFLLAFIFECGMSTPNNFFRDT